MNNYFESNRKNDCNGCGACALRCPRHAITMQEDNEGFLYPVIDKTRCINCGLCKKICSNNPKKINEVDAYSAINNASTVLGDSASGGIFSILSDYVLSKNGVVFGVRYDENLVVIHDYITDKKDVNKFRHSKYVRSDLNNSYVSVEKFLKDKRLVLFTGTPCQCAGLRAYLMKDYDNLITCDIICHANPSPKIFDMFKKNVEYKYNKKIVDIIFRSKKYGWHSGSHTDIFFEDGTSLDIPNFTDAFLNDLIDRPSCYNCRFCTTNRFSDFSIGDFWGIDKIDITVKDNNSGISLLCVNTNRARKIFEDIKENMIVKKYDKELAFKYNHNCNINPHRKRKDFFDKIDKEIINDKNIILYMKKYTKRPLYKRFLSKFKRIIKKVLKKNSW